MTAAISGSCQSLASWRRKTRMHMPRSQSTRATAFGRNLMIVPKVCCEPLVFVCRYPVAQSSFLVVEHYCGAVLCMVAGVRKINFNPIPVQPRVQRCQCMHQGIVRFSFAVVISPIFLIFIDPLHRRGWILIEVPTNFPLASLSTALPRTLTKSIATRATPSEPRKP